MPRCIRRTACALILSLGAGPCLGAGLSISPPHVHFAPGQMTAEVRLTNDSEVAVSVQASAQSWAQSPDGVEQESEAHDLVLYPKVFTIEAGRVQVVRLGRLPTAPSRPPTEVAYRLTLRELPVDTGASTGVQVSTRLRLPVWLEPETPRAEWTLDEPRASPQSVAVAIDNRGNAHLQIADVTYAALALDGSVKSEVVAGGWYVLAGASKNFPARLPEGFCKGAVRIRVTARTPGDSRSREWPAASLCGRGA